MWFKDLRELLQEQVRECYGFIVPGAFNDAFKSCLLGRADETGCLWGHDIQAAQEDFWTLYGVAVRVSAVLN